MAQCKLTAREFIVNTFSPQIAAVCSNNAETTCQKNNLSFTELLQPFCRLNCEGHIKDPQGNTVVVRCLQFSIRDVNNSPPEPTIARRMLNETVSSSFTERSSTVNTGLIELTLPISIPWFETWRDTFLNVQYPSDHEFTKHFLACMIVVSTSDDEPLEIIQQMATKLNQSIPGQLPKWFNNNVLRYYVLIHDTHQDNKKKAEDVFREMKNVYGVNNCFLLQMNSRPPGQSDDNIHLPDPWSQFIIKNGSFSSGSEQNSSPRTPADTSGVSAMPCPVNTDTEKVIHVGTPLTPQAPNSLATDFTDLVISSEIPEPSVQLEIGQEAVPITIHPLSPVNETTEDFIPGHSKIHLDNTPININVWADSPGQTAVPHGTRLSLEDLERLKSMMSEFYLKSLLPYVERQIGQLNDVISNKKGVSRSLFSATKRWFGTSKPGVPGSVPANVVIYTSESPELQLRRLGDLCFMFGLYGLAYQAYHNAKRDFAADQAWLYYAGALEMAALSAFMQDEMTRKTIEYMDDAILTYLNTCKMPQFATRATLLSAECLKNRGLYADAAKQLIRMTSEDSDLRSALLLEQAAYCFVGPKMIRKYAFHIVIAGHRFSKAGQKKHSLRCYQQAYQIYYDKGWSFAEDHIHFTLGRQAASLKQTAFAAKVYEKLLNPVSKQPALQQAAFLREFLHITNVLSQESKIEDGSLSILPLPLINGNQIKVLPGPLLKPGNNLELVSQISSILQDSDETSWSKLEERIVTEAQGSVPMIFKPTISIYSDLSNNSSKMNVVIDEPIYFSVELVNPLQISVPLTQITLLWSFETQNNEIFSNELSPPNCESLSSSIFKNYMDVIETQTIDNFLLQPASKQDLVLHLKPKIVGSLSVLGLSYNLLSSPDFNQSLDETRNANLSLFVCGKRLFKIKGPKLKHVKEKPGAVLYGNDYRLLMNVLEKAPFMEISFSKFSPEMLSGEIQRVELTVKNIGNAPLTNVHIGFSNPKLISFSNQKSNINNGKVKNKLHTSVYKMPLMTLNIGEEFSTIMWVRAPHETGNHKLDLLFYYENSESKSNPKHRVSRLSWHLTVLDSIQINAVARTSMISGNGPSTTLNLIVKIKNMNQVHDPFINEIQLMNVAFQSKNWNLIDTFVSPANIVKIQPQEITHFFLKLKRNLVKNSDIISKTELYSNVSLTEEDNMDPITKSPYVDFIEKRNISSNTSENLNEQQQQSAKELEDNLISIIMNIKSVLILRWRAKVMERGAIVREAVGQHHVDIKVLSKYYNQPVETKPEPIEYGARLKIFGPDANVDSRTFIKKDNYSETECQKNVLWYFLDHVRHKKHDFKRKRICVLPVIMLMQNNSPSRVEVKINTIGTSSQTHLPSIKSQLYTPQASSFYRYAGHTAIECNIEPFGYCKIKLQAIIPASGTYDLASRIDVSVRLVNRGEFIPQKWHIESICIVNNELS